MPTPEHVAAAKQSTLNRLRDLLARSTISSGERRQIGVLIRELRETNPDPDIPFTPFDPVREGPIVRPFKGAPISSTTIDKLVVQALKRPFMQRKKRLHSVTDQVFDMLRRSEAETLPDKPLMAGQRGADLPLSTRSLESLLRLTAMQLCDEQARVIWDDGENELIVHAAGLGASIVTGRLRIDIPVACDGLKTIMQVPFAVGDRKHKMGLVMATADRPVGDAAVARIWGDALIALAWRAVLDVLGSMAGASGRDTRNRRLVPRALSASRGQLRIETQARLHYTPLFPAPGRPLDDFGGPDK